MEKKEKKKKKRKDCTRIEQNKQERKQRFSESRYRYLCALLRLGRESLFLLLFEKRQSLQSVFEIADVES